MGQELIAFLKDIPGAVKAVARVIGAPVASVSAWFDIVTAAGERHSREIRTKTEARAKVINAMSDAAIRCITEDDGLAYRAIEHFAADIVGKQANREAVAAEAIAVLRDNPPIKETGDVTPDWLNAFSAFAELASSEKVRQHWAAILAGEIRQPGSVSLITLQVLSLVDSDSAALISRYSRFCFRGDDGTYCLPISGVFFRSPRYDDIVALDSIGFLSLHHEARDNAFAIGSHVVRRIDGAEFGVRCALLTKAGRQIVELVGEKATESEIKFVFGQLDGKEYLELVELETGNVVIAAAKAGI